MPRFFLPDSFSYKKGDPLPEEIRLSEEDAFHLSVSLRARVGEKVLLCTRDGFVFSCEISGISGGKKNPLVFLTPSSVTESEGESPCYIRLFQGMPKGKKTDSIIQKCTELGASEIIFVYTDHAVPALSGEDKKAARFEKIAEGASKQCGRGRIPTIRFLQSLDEAIPLMKESEMFFACYENEDGKGLKEMLQQNFSSASFFIGPEGGISPRETELLKKNGIPTVSLGKRILRTETAGSAVLSMFLYEKEL